MNKHVINMDDENAEIHNIKSISRINSFLKRLLHSFFTIYKVFSSMTDQLYELENDLNFRQVDFQLIDVYNKILMFTYNQISEVLEYKVITHGNNETTIIKPVNVDKCSYDHKLELTYFMKGNICLTKHIGSISNVSISKINNFITLLRSRGTYHFMTLDTDSDISTNDFRTILNENQTKSKELMGLFYNDIETIKRSFGSLLDVLSDAVMLTECKHEQKKWKLLFEKIKSSVDMINKCLLEIKK